MKRSGPRGSGRERVAAIVPAYNEQETIAEVIAVLKATPSIDEIFVVSDGSDDRTVEIARDLGVRTIHLRENQGKGMAMAVGVEHTDAPVLLFVDGDILNLTVDLLERLIEPVLASTSDMNVGIRHRGWVLDHIQARTGPLLSGIRCLRREIFEAVPETHLRGFAVETGLNWSCRQLGQCVTTVVMHNLKHLVKEKKRGLVPGFQARYRMFAAVFGAWTVLHVKHPPLRSAAPHADLARAELEYINF
ncbi:MAG TPA: glycosyltransferase family 2 protein [Thermoanaerobaculia bacterium]|nr:glycosyltransferase family 2 protein [Thermoanaerobaculia bacterium]